MTDVMGLGTWLINTDAHGRRYVNMTDSISIYTTGGGQSLCDDIRATCTRCHNGTKLSLYSECHY